ncbi:MAG: DUF2914 domain-containing protein [Thermodesulfobacteriota bacterium]|nr:DUF2914 domain-containing protein [Thermodesulfobacteriota bacterium]
MNIGRLILLVALLCGVFVAGAQALEVEDVSITTRIVNRAPVDSLNTVPANVDKLYCYTRIIGATEDTWITHVWYCKDKELARVRLSVDSSNWRTWSSKRVLSQWKGTWRVEVLDAEGQVLLIVPFSIF